MVLWYRSYNFYVSYHEGHCIIYMVHTTLCVPYGVLIQNGKCPDTFLRLEESGRGEDITSTWNILWTFGKVPFTCRSRNMILKLIDMILWTYRFLWCCILMTRCMFMGVLLIAIAQKKYCCDDLYVKIDGIRRICTWLNGICHQVRSRTTMMYIWDLTFLSYLHCSFPNFLFVGNLFYHSYW